jgi:hypothetical protein
MLLLNHLGYLLSAWPILLSANPTAVPRWFFNPKSHGHAQNLGDSIPPLESFYIAREKGRVGLPDPFHLLIKA